MHSERSWCKQEIRYFTRCEYEIIDKFKKRYSVKYLCSVMGVSRCGYYKWFNRKDKPNRYEKDRILPTNLLKEQHLKYKSKGYRYLAQLVRNETGWFFSDNKCCKCSRIKSKAGRGRSNKGEEHQHFPNTVNGKWDAKKPMKIIVSDMTAINHKGVQWEWVYMLDTFNNQIIAGALTKKKGGSIPYYKCLETLTEKTKEQTYPVTLTPTRAVSAPQGLSL